MMGLPGVDVHSGRSTVQLSDRLHRSRRSYIRRLLLMKG